MNTYSEQFPVIQHQPLVSVLMLTYNRARYIQEAIQSVIDQTYFNWELIIIDDGSTDTTAEIVRGCQESRIRYIKHGENAGLHARRKESLGYIKGEYVAVLDSDDLWTNKDKLRQQVEHLEEQEECVLIGTFTTLINEHGKKIGSDKFATGDQAIRERILTRNQFTHSSVLMRTNALKQATGYQPTLAEDLELFLQLGMIGTFANIPEYYTSYRIHQESLNPQRTRMALAVLSIIKKHKDNYPHYFRALCKAYLRIGLTVVRSVMKALVNVIRTRLKK